MIEIKTSYRTWADEVAIWFIERDSDGGIVYKIVDGALQPGERFKRADLMPKPTLILEAHYFQKLLDAAKEYEKPTPATVRHLEDAIAVRDRLLTLIETRNH